MIIFKKSKKIVDIIKMVNDVFIKDGKTQINLAKVCEIILRKPLSKYE